MKESGEKANDSALSSTGEPSVMCKKKIFSHFHDGENVEIFLHIVTMMYRDKKRIPDFNRK